MSEELHQLDDDPHGRGEQREATDQLLNLRSAQQLASRERTLQGYGQQIRVAGLREPPVRYSQSAS